MAIEEYASIIPRTLYHILTVPDAAVSFKWIVQLPKLPEPYVGNGVPESKGGFFDAWGNIDYKGGGIVKNITDTVSAAVDTVQKVGEWMDDTLGPTTLMMRAKSVSFSPEQLTSSTIQTQARLRSFPSSVTTPNINITFYEDYNYTALNYLTKWHRCVVNENGVFRAPNGPDGYAKELKLHIFDTVGIKKGVATFLNCYPERIGEYSFNSESGSIETSCEFNVHRVLWEPASLNWGSTISSVKSGVQNITEKFL